MLLSSDETLTMHRQEHTERIEAAERHRAAQHLIRMRRAQRWARRLDRLAARLDRLAQTHLARLS